MTENSKGKRSIRNYIGSGITIPNIILITISIYLIVPGVLKWRNGIALEEWIVEVVMGLVLVSVFISNLLVPRIEKRPSSQEGFGLSDWIVIIGFIFWVLFCLIFYVYGFYYRGESVLGLLSFGVAGLVGIAAMFYKKYKLVEQ